MPLGPRELTVMHRRQQLALRNTTVAQMERLWPALDWADLDRSYPGFAASVLQLVSKNRRTSSGLAAAYLRAFRIASGLSGDVKIVAPLMAPEQFATSLRVTSIVAVKKSAAELALEGAAMASALVWASGAMSRLVLNGGRETVTASVTSDPQAQGWIRVLGSGGCPYCRERAGRRMTSDAVFKSHGKCGCTAEPIYS